MTSCVWLVAVGVAAVALSFVAILVLDHPYGNIVAGVLSCGGLLAVGRAYAIYKRRQDGPRP